MRRPVALRSSGPSLRPAMAASTARIVGGASATTVGLARLVVRSASVWCQEWLPMSVNAWLAAER